ncbi:LysR family transcriptional regulator [Pseudomonas agarici]|uniref:LysR family transcriptional regulator n=1 Tax=Pseudomonas agarici TaxID=46677 RepID=A0A0X1T7N0_PSEAA|nr:LysR substrate-binding domain-containing protein [Pseudomonas agarici]AMB88075.1 LysR family transcriptional regulator [Pseudomonas agarici]
MVAFNKLDLNLIRVFNAVMEEGSVLRASQRLHLSQSAVSHALSRLREVLDQEIFVRTGRGMTPTSYAMEIIGPLRHALHSMNDVLTRAASPFEPQHVQCSFTIAANDYICATLIPQLNRQLTDAAPRIDLIITPATRLDLAEQIDLGRIDVAIGTFSRVPERLRTAPVLFQKEVFICSSSHPIGSAPLRLQDVVEYSLAVVSLEGYGDGALNGYILERGLARQAQMYDRQALELALAESELSVRKQVIVPHFLALPMLLEQGELLAIVPEPLARTFARTLGLMIKPLPYPVARQQVDMAWHGSNDDNPAQRWLRGQIYAAANEISRPSN